MDLPPSNAPTPSKIYYLDNLKILLTVLVIIHHALVTYGAPGGWYYSEKTSAMLPLIIMTMVVATNQAFFMGFFFLMSALFTEPSYLKKGRVRFFKDRLVRLGIPLLFYSFLLSPVMNYLVAVFGDDYRESFVHYLGYYDDWIDFGVLWFVAALLLFTLLFDILKKNTSDNAYRQRVNLPSNSGVVLFSVMLGVVSFIVRIFFPVGWTLRPLGWQLGHFPQYIAMFFIGIVATRNQWLGSLTWKQGKKLLPLPILMVVVGFPIIYLIKTITGSELPTFSGGWHWQSLFYSIWEQVTGISIILVLLCYGKEKWNSTSAFLTGLSRSAFAAYIFHPLFLISISLALKNIDIDPVYKLLVSIPVAVCATFLFCRFVVRLPVVNKVI